MQREPFAVTDRTAPAVLPSMQAVSVRYDGLSADQRKRVRLRGVCMKIELYRRGRGWLPCSPDAEKVLGRMSQGEIGWFKPLRIRDPVEHRRYWALMTLCAENCERIQLPYGGVMIVNTKDDVHTAIKLLTGHVDTIFDAFGKPAFQIPKSTSYEDMTADDWSEFWPRVVDAVMQHILPGLKWPEMELEIMKCLRIAA